jgi:Ca2+-binding RTX toxin-like protein
MATYRFSTLRDGQSVSFRPGLDVLNFDQSAIAAADIRVFASGANTRIEYGSKDILLLNTTPFQLTVSNVTFVNGSRLVVGSDAANSLLGNGGRDHLMGFAGNDTLNGGAGADRLDGGLGNDTYHVTAGDVLVDAGGIDTVIASISWNLADGFENLTITGASATSTQGNNLANTIIGNSGNNYINPRGGNDTVLSGAGNDTIDMSTGGTSSPGAKTIDGGAGRDGIDYNGYALSAVRVDLEAGTASGGGSGGTGNAALTGIEDAAGGAYNDSLAGTGGDNFLFGAAGNDILDGREGNDRLEGGAGNDTFAISMKWDWLGYPEDGIDTMDGGLGNDTYWVTPGDIIRPDTGGIDHVMSPRAWTLGAGLENLTVVGTHEGTIDPSHGMRLVGNDLANRIDGQAAVNVSVDGRGGNDTIYGTYWADHIDGGTGRDVLYGLGHYDTFFFRAAAGTANADTIVGFNSGEATIAMENGVFTALGAAGRFAEGDARFAAGAGFTSGRDGNDRVVYDTSTGNLYYDADGSGAGAAQIFATLQGAPDLAASDFGVI